MSQAREPSLALTRSPQGWCSLLQSLFLTSVDAHDGSVEALSQRVSTLEAAHLQLLRYRVDFGDALGEALTSYMRDGERRLESNPRPQTHSLESNQCPPTGRSVIDRTARRAHGDHCTA